MAVTQKSSFGSYSVSANDDIIAEAIHSFQNANVMSPLVKSDIAGDGSASVTFVDFTPTASSSVSSLSEGSEASSIAVASTAHTASIGNYVVRSDITDLARLGTAGDLEGDVGANLGQACALKVDDLLVSLFSGFSQTAAGAGTALTLDAFFEASRQLHAAGAPLPFSFVGHSKQIWGSKGLQGLLVATNSSTQVADNPISAEMLSNGYIGKLAGVNIYFSEEITVDGSDDAAGGMFSRGALGLGISNAGLINIETQRDASYQHDEYIASVKCGVTEIKDSFGVYVLSDVS